MAYRILRDQWFLCGVLIIGALTLWNPGEVVVAVGNTFKKFSANDLGIALIFILSGLELEWDHILQAIRDWKATALSLAAIFIFAPLLAWLLSFTTSSEEIRFGLMLVGVLPTTLAMGVMMTGMAGGRVAHALFITVLAYILCIITIPMELSLMITGQNLAIHLDYPGMIQKLATLVLLPLFAGMALRKPFSKQIASLPFRLTLLSRCIILLIIFISFCDGREKILGNIHRVPAAFLLVIILHFLLAGTLWFIMRLLRWEAGRRESVFFMGIQKTITVAISLQSTFFPEYGLVLVVCIFYHVSQLVIDSYFANRMAVSKK